MDIKEIKRIVEELRKKYCGDRIDEMAKKPDTSAGTHMATPSGGGATTHAQTYNAGAGQTHNYAQTQTPQTNSAPRIKGGHGPNIPKNGGRKTSGVTYGKNGSLSSKKTGKSTSYFKGGRKIATIHG